MSDIGRQIAEWVFICLSIGSVVFIALISAALVKIAVKWALEVLHERT